MRRERILSPMPGTLFPLHVADDTPKPSPRENRTIYEEQGHAVCEALGGHPARLAGLTSPSNKVDRTEGQDLEDPFIESGLYSLKLQEHLAQKTTPVSDPKKIPRVGKSPRILLPPGEEDAATVVHKEVDPDLPVPSVSKGHLAMKVFLDRSAQIHEESRLPSGSSASEFDSLLPSNTASRLSLQALFVDEESPRKENTDPALPRNQKPQESDTLQQTRTPNDMSRKILQSESALPTVESNTMKELTPERRPTIIPVLLPSPSQSPSQNEKESRSPTRIRPGVNTPTKENSRSSAHSSFDLPIKDREKLEEKIQTGFAMTADGFRAVKLVKPLGMPEDWYNQSGYSSSHSVD